MSRDRMTADMAQQKDRDRPDADEEHDEVAIRFEHVSKTFGASAVLNDVTFTVQRSRAFCLLGRSGTGKSVTLRHIIGLVAPDQGHVLVEGHDISQLTRRTLSAVRRRIGFLFQGAALFDSMTVGDNVAFPMRRHSALSEAEIQQRARAKLSEVGLESEVDKMPADLSGGMRKRAGLARAMSLDPPILLVDEPSAGLDPITTREIDRLLIERKRRGTTLVVVTHNIPSARLLGDEFALLHDGRIVAHGSAEELDSSSDRLVQAFMRSEGGG